MSIKGPGFTEDLAMQKVEKEIKTQKEISFAPSTGLGQWWEGSLVSA